MRLCGGAVKPGRRHGRPSPSRAGPGPLCRRGNAAPPVGNPAADCGPHWPRSRRAGGDSQLGSSRAGPPLIKRLQRHESRGSAPGRATTPRSRNSAPGAPPTHAAAAIPRLGEAAFPPRRAAATRSRIISTLQSGLGRPAHAPAVRPPVCALARTPGACRVPAGARYSLLFTIHFTMNSKIGLNSTSLNKTILFHLLL